MTSSYFTPVHHDPIAAPEQSGSTDVHPVVIVGAGPVGMVVALELAELGVSTVVLESRSAISEGSRAICVSARSLEILDHCGVLHQTLELALPWSGGRSFYRDREVLAFAMAQRADGLPPMVNLQQCLLEQILLDRIEAEPRVELRWQSRLDALAQGDETVRLSVASPLRTYDLLASWVVAADGPQSAVRRMVGLALKGTTHGGRYVIADLHLRSERPAERLCWFDPPTFPGKTVLLHKQPMDIWRLDYQIDDTEDLAAATDPDTVFGKIEGHLRWMGETGPWQPEWLSSYRAHSLTLDTYRSGRVLLAGDAAHLVPIFGVRGLNGGLADAHNLAWKLSAVLAGSPAGLLDSYSSEQRAAALDNIEAGSASARFMSPSDPHAILLRDAALSLALVESAFATLVDPRQTVPATYPASPFLTADQDRDAWVAGPSPGELAPDVRIGPDRLDHRLHGDFMLLRFGGAGGWSAPDGLDLGIEVVDVSDPRSASAFDAVGGAVYLLRPDRYVAARWRSARADQVSSALAHARQGSGSHAYV